MRLLSYKVRRLGGSTKQDPPYVLKPKAQRPKPRANPYDAGSFCLDFTIPPTFVRLMHSEEGRVRAGLKTRLYSESMP
jgi:hypothetical protein